MTIESVEFILFVNDQKISRDFYAGILGKSPSVDVEGITEFDLPGGYKLALMPNQGIAKYISHILPDPAEANGIPRCELYILCSDPYQAISIAIISGAKLVDEVKLRNWGHHVGYFADPDGHLIAVAQKA